MLERNLESWPTSGLPPPPDLAVLSPAPCITAMAQSARGGEGGLRLKLAGGGAETDAHVCGAPAGVLPQKC